MRIKKTSQTTTLPAQVVNAQSNSSTDTYSCDYINGVLAYNGSNTGTVNLTVNTSEYNFIEIIATGADGGYFSSGKLPITENMLISLIGNSFRDNGTTLCFWLSTLKLTNNTLIPQSSKWFYMTQGSSPGLGDGNFVNVNKVYLYK